MIFEIDGKRFTEGLTEDFLIEMLHTLDGQTRSFALLAQTENDYIQTSGDPENGFVLEWYDGVSKKHYYCAEDRITVERVIKAFTLYMKKNETLKTDVSWDPLDLKNTSQPFSPTFFIASGVFVLAVIWRLI